MPFIKRVALFLGAGASRGFNYPTTAEFLEALKGELPRDEREILIRIARSKRVTDIEHVLKVIDAVIMFDTDRLSHSVFSYEPQVKIPVKLRRVKDASTHKESIQFDQLDWNLFVEQCRRTKEEIISRLHLHYAFDPTRTDDIVKAYDVLIHLIKDVSTPVEEIHVFTTNYDRIIEEYSLKTELPVSLVDGFIRETRTNRRFWFANDFERKEKLSANTTVLKLFKLHGSLDWRQTHDNRIEQVDTEEKCSVARKYKRNVLIYPTEEDYSEEPFRTLLNHFRETTTQYKAFLVIGFSFRDAQLNTIFMNHIKKGGILFVVSPHAKEDVTNNLLDGLGKEEQGKLLGSRIVTVKGHFPQENAFDRIRKACDTLRSG